MQGTVLHQPRNTVYHKSDQKQKPRQAAETKNLVSRLALWLRLQTAHGVEDE